jgi:hypothetical protein
MQYLLDQPGITVGGHRYLFTEKLTTILDYLLVGALNHLYQRLNQMQYLFMCRQLFPAIIQKPGQFAQSVPDYGHGGEFIYDVTAEFLNMLYRSTIESLASKILPAI